MEVEPQPSYRSVSEFDSSCPFYALGTNNPHCCFYPSPDSGIPETCSEPGQGVETSTDRLPLFTNDLAEFDDKIRFRIYPRCYNLLKYLPCVICHPNVSDMFFKVDRWTGQVVDPVSFRFCSDFAEDVYKECRRAIYNDVGKSWIVPEDFGIRDFQRVVGVQFGADGEVNQTLDVAGQTCIDLREWGAAAPRGWPSVILLGLVACAALTVLF
jgi:hypothetical protein